MNRSSRARMGQETVEIAAQGWYESSDGRKVNIANDVAACLLATRLYTPSDLDRPLMSRRLRQAKTCFEVHNETTLTAARRIVVERGHTNTLCLNFASAKNPGGGFLSGSRAQEESLARSSALHASLTTQHEYYDSNRACGTPLYTDHMILSPHVPVFRDDEGTLLPEPYRLSILTVPAVNAGAVRKNEPASAAQIGPIMAKRISKVLAVAAHHDYEHLILGAWGCGVFQNDPHEVAELFANELLGQGSHSNCFDSITFAVLDTSNEQNIVAPFTNALRPRTKPMNEELRANQHEIATVYRGEHLAMMKQGNWEFVTRNTARPAVGIVAVTDAGNVVLVEQFRTPVGRTVYELPAGLAGDIAGEENESLLEAARRELLEETGYIATHWTELADGYSSPGLTDERIVLFLAGGLVKQGPGGGDDSEQITIHEVPLDNVIDWLNERDAIADLKLLAGLYAAQTHFKNRGHNNGSKPT